MLALLLVATLSPFTAEGQVPTPNVPGALDIESCQFIGDVRDNNQQTVPPGLDEPLRCDHRCFVDELGFERGEYLDKPVTMHQMYSIGWRLTHLVFTWFEGRPIWTVYFERPLPTNPNDCYELYAKALQPQE